MLHRTSRSSCWPASSASRSISKVPNTLHTPLMSGTNAIHGIVVLGGILAARPRRRRRAQQGPARHRDRLRHDQRRRRLPRHRPHARDVQEQARRPKRGERGGAAPREPQPTVVAARSTSSPSRSSSTGCMGLTGPRTAVRGNRIAAVGMAIAVVATLLIPDMGNWGLIVARRRDRHRGRRPRGAPGEDDRDAADGGAVQRRRRRRGRAHRVGRVPHERRLRGRADLRGDLHACSRRSSARSRSGARTSPSASCRSSCPGARSRSGRAQQVVNLVLLLAAVACAVAIVAGADAELLMIGLLRRGRAARQLRRAADRRRRHAGRDLAAQRVHRASARPPPASRSNNTALIVAGMIVGASGSILTQPHGRRP